MFEHVLRRMNPVTAPEPRAARSRPFCDMTLACAFVPLTLPPLLLALPLPGAQMLGDCVRGHSTPPLAPPLPDDDPCCA